VTETALLALASALVVGVADFLGGLATRSRRAVQVTLLTQSTTLVITAAAVLLVPADRVRAEDLAWGLLGGVSIGGAYVLFFTALARGQMGVVAPVTAMVGAVVPVAAGLAQGERPGAVAMAGVVVGLVAVLLVSVSAPAGAGPASTPRAVVGLAVLAGALFGSFFVVLGETAESSGRWPLLTARVGSVSLLLAVLALRPAERAGLRARAEAGGRSGVGLAVASGVCEFTASVLVLRALQLGPLVIASVLAALYPVTTMLLARVVLGEQLTRTQIVGVGLAALAAVMVSART
jgi:drug/metabolite transporter (DMT)-like permease